MGSIPTGGTLIFFIFWPNQTTHTRAHPTREALGVDQRRSFFFFGQTTRKASFKGFRLCARVGPTRTHTARDSLWPRVLMAYPRLRCVASALNPGPGLMREQVCESLKKNLREYSRFTSDCLTLELGHEKNRQANSAGTIRNHYRQAAIGRQCR